MLASSSAPRHFRDSSDCNINFIASCELPAHVLELLFRSRLVESSTRFCLTFASEHVYGVSMEFQQNGVRKFGSKSHLSLRTAARHIMWSFFFCNSSCCECCECCDCPKRDDWRGQRFVVVSMYRRPERVGVMVVVVVCGWKGRRKWEGGRSGLYGHGWCVWERGGRRKEGGGEGEGGKERATDSIEPQNSHKQSLLSGLVRHFHIFRKNFDMVPLVQVLSCLSHMLRI